MKKIKITPILSIILSVVLCMGIVSPAIIPADSYVEEVETYEDYLDEEEWPYLEDDNGNENTPEEENDASFEEIDESYSNDDEEEGSCILEGNVESSDGSFDTASVDEIPNETVENDAETTDSNSVKAEEDWANSFVSSPTSISESTLELDTLSASEEWLASDNKYIHEQYIYKQGITYSIEGTIDSITLTIDGTGTLGLNSEELKKSEVPTRYEGIFFPYLIKKIIINGDFSEIPKQFFSQYKNLMHVEINCNLKTIGESAFNNCTCLENIYLPEGLQEIGKGAFEACDSLEYLTLPESVISIGMSAFSKCKNLKTLNIPTNVSTIEPNVFNNCTNLDNVILPEGLTVIGFHAFEKCTSLSYINIPKSVKEIKSEAFINCSSLKKIDYYGPRPKFAFAYDNGREEGTNCFLNVTADVYYPAEYNEYVTKNYQGGGSLTYIARGSNIVWKIINEDNYLTLMISGTGRMEDYITAPWDQYSSDIRKVIIEDGIDNIGSNAFANCLSLEEVTIPDSVKVIGEMAFYNCKMLEGITLHQSIQLIGKSSFAHCESLKDITLPDGIKSIPDHAFEDCINLQTINMGKLLERIGQYAFAGCKSLLEIKIPDSVSVLSAHVFDGCTSIYSIDIDGTLESIEEYAFAQCESLIHFSLPNTITSIPAHAFDKCKKLEHLIIPTKVSLIGEKAFFKCENLQDISIPSSVSYIGTSAFEECIKLRNCNFEDPNASIEWGDSLFAFCKSLDNIVIPTGIIAIPSKTFFECDALTHFDLHDNITSLGESCFEGCDRIEAVFMPEKIAYISDKAFYSCKSLKAIMFYGDKPDVADLCFWNEYIRIFYPSYNSTWTERLDYWGNGFLTWSKWHPVDGAKAASGYIYSLQYPSSTLLGYYGESADVSIPDMIEGAAVSYIASSAFDQHKDITSVTIPSTVREIGDEAFYSCSNLETFSIVSDDNSSNCKIGSFAFARCSNLSKVGLGDCVDEISGPIFCETSVTSIVVPKSIQRCQRLSSGVFNADGGPLGDCESLTVVEFEDGTTIIPDYFCATCDDMHKSHIETVIIPETVESIGPNAFHNCTKMIIYGVKGSFADSYAATYHIPFRELKKDQIVIEKDADADSIMEEFDLDQFLSNIETTESFPFDGPEVKMGKKKFMLFTMKSNGMSIDINDKHQLDVDTEKKIIKVLLGFKPIVDESVGLDPYEEQYYGGTYGSSRRSKTWQSQYNNMKSLYKNIVGGNLTGDEIAARMKALDSKLLDKHSSLGLEFDAKIAGYLEFSYASGAPVFSEGGFVLSIQNKVEYDWRIPAFPAAYVAFSVSGKAELQGSVVKTVVGYGWSLDSDISMTVGLGLGVGSKYIAKTYSEGGIKGSLLLSIDFQYPQTSIEDDTSLKLNGNLYVESKILGFDGPSLEYQFADWQVYPPKENNTITSENDLLYAADRTYLANAPVELMNPEEAGGEDLFVEGNIYPYNCVNLIKLSDGSVLMVYIGDDGTKNDVNRTSLMYRVCRDGVWSAAKTINETGGLNDYPVVRKKNDAVYIIWQKAESVFASNATLEEVMRNVNLYYVVFENGVLSDPVRVSDGSNYEMLQRISSNNDEMAVSWVENDENDYFMSEGTNRIELAINRNGSWEKKEIYTGNREVASLEIDYIDDSLTAIYELGRYDNEGNYFSELMCYRDGSTKLLVEDGINPLIEDGVIYYIKNSKLYMYDAANDTTSFTGVTNIYDYQLIKDSLANYLIMNISDGRKSELHMRKQDLKTKEWSDSIQLTEYGKYIRNYSPIIDDGNLIIAMNLVEVNPDSSEGSIYGDASLHVVSFGNQKRLRLKKEVSYDLQKVFPGNDLPITFWVKNDGFNKVDSVKAEVVNMVGKVLQTETCNVSIAEGETAECIINYHLPAVLSKQEICIRLSASGSEGESTSSIVLGGPDLTIESFYLDGEDGNLAVSGKVRNIGYELSKNVRVRLYDGGEERILISEMNLSDIASQKESSFHFDIDESYQIVNPLISGNNVIAEVTSDTEDVDFGNNSSALLIQSKADSPFTLNRQALDLHVEEQADLHLAYITNWIDATQAVAKSSDDSIVSIQEELVKGSERKWRLTAKNPGNAVIEVSLAGKKKTCQVTVSEAPEKIKIDNSIVVKFDAVRYTGKALKPRPVSVVFNGFDLEYGTDYTLQYSKNVNAGNATASIIGTGIYAGTVKKTFLIKPANIRQATITNIIDKNYTGSAVIQNPVVKMNGNTLRKDVDYYLAYKNNVNIGEATIAIKGKGNYESIAVRHFQVKRASVTKAAISNIVSKVYSGKALTQSPVVSLNNKNLKLNTDYYLAYKNNINTGRATIAIKGKGKYCGVAVRYFAINPKPSWIVSLTSPKTKQIIIKWGKRTQISGYQIEISTKKNFAKPKQQKNVYNPAKLTMNLTVAKSKTTYYVRIRSFKKTKDKTYFSTWSAVKTVKTQ